MKQSGIRLAIDAAMTALSILLMGGTFLFPDGRIHEVLGFVLIGLWAVHVVINRRFYGTLRKGAYTVRRGLRVVVNAAVLLCAALLAASGFMLAFSSVGLLFARTVHLVCSHWYFVFVAMHIGLHVRAVAGRIFIGLRPPLPLFILAAAVSMYGIYAFFIRGFAGYLMYLRPFFFFDSGRGLLLFAADYSSILVLFAAAMYVVERILR